MRTRFGLTSLKIITIFLLNFYKKDKIPTIGNVMMAYATLFVSIYYNLFFRISLFSSLKKNSMTLELLKK